MGSSHRVDEEGEGNSKHCFTDYEVNINEIKPLSSHGSSDSYSSSGSSQELFDFLGNNGTDDHIEKPVQSELKSPRNLRVSFASSSDKQVYVLNRIPSLVFRGKPETPTDWSTASNESLFSIHIGNGSFSKDQFFMLYKSGELTKLDEQIIAQKNVLPSLKELDDMAIMDEIIGKGSGNATMVVKTSEVAEDDSDQKMAQYEEVQSSVSNAPMVDHGAVVGNLSLEKKPIAEVQNLPINSISSLFEESNISISFSFSALTATDGGRLSSVYGDQNNKGSPARIRNHQQQQKEFTEEMESQSPFSPQNGSSRSWFSWFSCCRCS